MKAVRPLSKEEIRCSGETPDGAVCTNCKAANILDCQFLRVCHSLPVVFLRLYTTDMCLLAGLAGYNSTATNTRECSSSPLSSNGLTSNFS